MNDKRIETINTNQSVAKKTKIVQSKNEAPPDAAGGSPTEIKIRKTPATRRASTTRKTSGATAKKGPATRTMPAEAGTMTEPSDDAVRLRAYFISERRRRFALPGNAESDWLEARRQLLFETSPR
ncbi:MAG: hypothetical protein WBX14_09350 [Candidatus Udaeobacter sp.]